MSKAAIIKGGIEGLPGMSSLLGPVSHRAVSGERMSKSQRVEFEASKRGFEEGYARGVEEGIADGVTQGLEEARAAYQQELEILRKELDLVTDHVQRAMQQWCLLSEERLTGLVSQLAERVIRAHLAVSRDSVLDIVKQGLEQVTHSQQATIRINPFDSAVMQRHKAELLALSPCLRSIEFVEDPLILGGAVIETDGGRIDVSIEGQLQAINDALGVA